MNNTHIHHTISYSFSSEKRLLSRKKGPERMGNSGNEASNEIPYEYAVSMLKANPDWSADRIKLEWAKSKNQTKREGEPPFEYAQKMLTAHPNWEADRIKLEWAMGTNAPESMTMKRKPRQKSGTEELYETYLAAFDVGPIDQKWKDNASQAKQEMLAMFREEDTASGSNVRLVSKRSSRGGGSRVETGEGSLLDAFEREQDVALYNKALMAVLDRKVRTGEIPFYDENQKNNLVELFNQYKLGENSMSAE